MHRLPFIPFALFASLLSGVEARASDHAGAYGYELQSASVSDSGAVFVDLMAADFFETSLRLSQSRRIEAQTASHYLSLDEAGRAKFREARKRQWREMSEETRRALRGTKTPRFENLDEAQKQTFRRIAAETLGAAGRPASQRAPGDI